MHGLHTPRETVRHARPGTLPRSDSTNGRTRSIADVAELLDALERRQREAPAAFPRCVLLVLASDASADATRATLARIPPRLAALVAEIAVLCTGRDDEDAPAAVSALGIPNLRWRANPRRYGHGGRRKIAFEYALEHEFEHALVFDADSGEALERIADVWAPLVLDGADAAIGSPAAAGFARALNSFLLNRILGLRFAGWGASTRAYACDVLRRVPFQLNADDRRFDTQILVQCRALGAAVREVPLPRAAVPGGSLSSAVAYRLHQLHVHRDGAFLVDHGVHYTLKHSPHGSHMQILEAIRPGSRVLDLGCSQGLLARALASKGVRIVGVDRTPESSVSRELEAYHRRDLELPLDIPEERAFDYVVVSDVIEHVKEREQLLRSARRYLKPDGRLLISTPNIAIWFYRLSLAIGRFEYGPRGVLDETHVHLYTRATFRREVERGGFRILRERVTALPFEVVFESTGQSRAVAALSAAYHGCARAWPKLFAYQFIIEAEVTTLLDPDPGPSAS
jgi:2-polyprenyl-3-methyl-5-hydroxy-6-metoxy-1,4-benzoquinol methylase